MSMKIGRIKNRRNLSEMSMNDLLNHQSTYKRDMVKVEKEIQKREKNATN